MMLKGTYLFLLSMVIAFSSFGQENRITPDHVYSNNIKSVKVEPKGDNLFFPIIQLNSNQQLKVSFDDLSDYANDYYYTILLCNSDWKPTSLNPYDYIDGFQENRISDYKFSTVPLQKYVHYTFNFPNSNLRPKLSGNYILKVYLNGDTSQLAFTRRILISESGASIQGAIRQPVNPAIFQTYQKIDFNVTLQKANIQNPLSQVKVFILQNERWDNAIQNLKPTFIRGNKLVYNTEDDCVFPAMKEWRWADLRSFRLQTERVADIRNTKNTIDVFLRPDANRSRAIYVYRKDIDGHYIVSILESGYVPDYEADYAKVHFTFPAREPFAGSNVYVFGELTNYEYNDSNKMTYNPDKRAYEATLYLKQGYYNYVYGIVPEGHSVLETSETEGNWWETENNYTILVYFRPLGDRSDHLIGVRTLNSLEEK